MSLHNEIMNIKCDTEGMTGINLILAYKRGHRDARHAAAELVLKADKEISYAAELFCKLIDGDYIHPPFLSDNEENREYENILKLASEFVEKHNPGDLK